MFFRLTTTCLAAAALVFALASSAPAEPAGAIAPPSADERAKTSFGKFADTWMEKVKTAAEKHRKNPTIRPGAPEPMITYRDYADDYAIELRPTGHAAAPYVGILRYSEQVFSCTSIDATDCSLASTVPVTEIFRFQNGRWVY